MSAKTETKTITLRLPVDLLNFLEIKAVELRRSKSNYIQWLIDQKRKEDIPTIKLSEKETQKIEKAIDDHYAGKTKTTEVSTKQELHDLLTKMSQ